MLEKGEKGDWKGQETRVFCRRQLRTTCEFCETKTSPFAFHPSVGASVEVCQHPTTRSVSHTTHTKHQSVHRMPCIKRAAGDAPPSPTPVKRRSLDLPPDASPAWLARALAASATGASPAEAAAVTALW